MAHNSSGTLSTSQSYSLGEYLLRLIVGKVSEESITSIQCNCSKGTEHAQTGIDEHITVNVKSWRVEANDTTADAYARIYRNGFDTSPVTQPISSASSGTVVSSIKTHLYSLTNDGAITHILHDTHHISHIYASSSNGTKYIITEDGEEYDTGTLNSTYTYGGKTVYYSFNNNVYWQSILKSASPACNGGTYISTISTSVAAKIAWIMVYGDPAIDSEKLVARFAIDIADAGGTSWDDPGSTGDASKTLEVTVTGALSGRHNDPLNDEVSYSYLPADQDAATVYGSGGDGGHGGGGGAGASTVIIHTIATDRAGSVDYTAKAKRHGYGSGGGKGGKGGDGCILVYY